MSKHAALICSLLLAGCMASAPAQEDAAAIITNPSTATQSEIQRVIAKALNGASVTIAADAFTRDSTISIERAAIRDDRGLLVNGRDPGRPEFFELRKEGRRCVLVQPRTNVREVLRGVKCRPK